MAWSPPDTIQNTFEDWLKTPEDGNRYELIDGRIVVSPPGSFEHQSLIVKLNQSLANWSDRYHLGHVPGECPLFLSLQSQILIPDVTIVLNEHIDRQTNRGIEGAPDLIVEILSPSTRQRDLTTKRDIYAQAGVPEYWLVDPETQTITCLLLAEGHYVQASIAGELLISPTIPHLEIDVVALFTPYRP